MSFRLSKLPMILIFFHAKLIQKARKNDKRYKTH
nr:MAG TPA: hypothetical protein [Bacteriophage sp.]